MASSSVGDESELRRRKQEKEDADKAAERAKANQEDSTTEMSPMEKEYADYFKKHYGENPRTDVLGIDGCGLFCLIYIVVAGVIFTIIYASVYSRQRNAFDNIPWPSFR
mmetsp:Transcript_28590/g.51832  ORF Transcript_28590/g.51832 Transcript_28590/m.51832 type:complete len:109 (+) Transcript_28590:58-384(+)|eukprot:CAMPEP_0197648752 /NCGR_PEP_ID=MMETSP1338-20131121/27942_1 /TAXON_ID=43686 ORGANISM="Pelagodinium beii, Strain RCC1491" /NCGR_SAMPLE_ID=MMETSP1338 /ASSEMBLY_ACC=CAM_ASM_000754 /LENGTH=108 /DNA_ID=CAMNT_0043222805 /DNA_START=58 /DNA_END=384 /DNA_ORIENTATION=-